MPGLRRSNSLAQQHVSSSFRTNGGVLHLDDLVPETTSNSETKMRSARDILNDRHG